MLTLSRVTASAVYANRESHEMASVFGLRGPVAVDRSDDRGQNRTEGLGFAAEQVAERGVGRGLTLPSGEAAGWSP